MHEMTTTIDGRPEKPKGFFTRIDWSSFWTVTLLSFALYFFTLAPTVSLEDGGELAVASDYLGVPHPPGYPIWTLITWFFQWVFHWVRYYGQPDSNAMLVWKSLQDVFTPGVNGYPNPTWSVGLASAVCGALACGFLALLVSRSGSDLLRSVRRFNEVLGPKTEALFCWAGAVSAGLLLACSPVLWSQSVIVEVYSLNALFQILVFLLIYRWMCRPQERKTLYLMALVFGLGLTNHQTLLFMGFALAAAILIADVKLFRDFMWAGIPLVGLVLFNEWASRNGQETLLWRQGPPAAAFWFQTLFVLAVPLVALFLLPNGRVVCSTLLWIGLGLSFYVYLFFSGEQNPPMNWGYPRIWAGFMHAVTRGQYEPITPTNIFSERFLIQLGLFLTDLRRQFTLPVTLGGMLPFCAWRVKIRNRTIPMIWVALLMAMMAVPLIIAESPLREAPWPALAAAARNLYMVLIAGIVFSGGVGSLVMGLGFLSRLGRVLREPATGWATRGLILLPFLLAVGAILYADGMVLRACFSRGDAAAILFGLAVVFGPIGLAALVYHAALRTGRITYEFAPRVQHWMVGSSVAFFSVSFIFLAILNNAPDVQTQFIGRVQFIQTHVIYALWLGYGALFAMAVIETRFLGWRALRIGLVLGVLALPGLLLWQNAYDKTQVALLGGAEQNGHDFGWQFGQWSMQGAKAILQELPEEERAAYPNPQYPPEMLPGAIFYGGTDPGRFVPTYMIFSAHVRQDIFLITQNALADATYMSVLRDLYGEKIWIPDTINLNQAFAEYVEGVRGRGTAGTDVVVKDGRVSVQGVQGVMEINAILTRMIFEKNKFRHPFYVEESYVIPWMYPYLLPHGLILQLHAEPVELTPERMRDDRAFWDWYTARLLRNPRFLRDLPARKSFSKLRTAIAGVYLARQKYAEAEYAFRQAVDLYPLTPEANARLADLYLQQGFLEKAQTLMAEFYKGDPNNERVEKQLEGFRNLIELDHRRMVLEAQITSGPQEVSRFIELADLHRKMGRWDRLEPIARRLVFTDGLAKEQYIQIAQMALEANHAAMGPVVDKALRQALLQDPKDVRLWTDLLVLQLASQSMDVFFAVLDTAIATIGPEMTRVLREDMRFSQVWPNPEFRKRMPAQGLPRRTLSEDQMRLLR